MKAKKQDNMGVAPLKSNGGLTNDSKVEAEILNNQFKSVFTKLDPNSQIPPLLMYNTALSHNRRPTKEFRQWHSTRYG